MVCVMGSAGGPAPRGIQQLREEDTREIERLLNEMAFLGTDDTKRGRVKPARYDDFLLRIGASAARILEELLDHALRAGYSDIHFELRSALCVRVRDQGRLRTIMQLPHFPGRLVMGRLKVLSGLSLTTSSRPSDGHMTIKSASGEKTEARTNLIRLLDGEKIVVRIMKPAATLSLERLGLDNSQLELVYDLIARPGLLLVGGPAGSGKTTTIYAAMLALSLAQLNVVSLEDPVETVLPGVTQVEIDSDHGFSFQEAFRATLRQDPDVVVIGEIRDRSSAETAVRASLTGRPVIASIHADDTVGAIYRLFDLGIDGGLVSSAITGAISQRLIRTACPKCFKAGCQDCGWTGFGGRTGVFDVLQVTPALRLALARSATLHELRQLRDRTAQVRSSQHVVNHTVAGGAAAADVASMGSVLDV